MALRLAYYHAVLHATRPFLLVSQRQPEAGDDGEAEAEVAECISAASQLLSTFDSMAAAGGTVFHAFWWTSYVVFCVLTVVYVWEIQRVSSTSSLFAASPSGVKITNGRGSQEAEMEMVRLRDLAERCRGHLERSTAANSPTRRYSIVLEELRAEAQAQNGLRRSRNETRAEQSVPERDGTPMLGAEQQQHAGTQSQLETEITGQRDDEVPEGLSTSLMGWQTSDWLDLDSSVSCVPMNLQDIC